VQHAAVEVRRAAVITRSDEHEEMQQAFSWTKAVLHLKRCNALAFQSKPAFPNAGFSQQQQ
jgi:hypothetical protein